MARVTGFTRVEFLNALHLRAFVFKLEYRTVSIAYKLKDVIVLGFDKLSIASVHR